MKVLIIIASVLALGASKAVDPNIELPSYLHVCKRDDPKRDECIKEAIQTLLPALRQKHETLSLPEIDPFAYDAVTFSYKNSNLLNGVFRLKNVKTYGMSRGKIQTVKSNFKDNTMTIQAEVFFPKLFASGNYNSNMTFNGFQVQSKGQYNVTMKDIKAKWNIQGTVDSEGFMKVEDFDIFPEANDMKISVSGIFPDPVLNNVANDFFNQYWRVLYKDMVTETRKQWEPILLETLNKFFAQIPFRRLLL